MIPLTDDQLRAVQAKAEQAKDVQWDRELDIDTCDSCVAAGEHEWVNVGPVGAGSHGVTCETPAAEFIAACDPQTVLALVAEVRRLRETVAEMTLRRDMSAQHPSCYMREEMDERCWGIGDLVFQMGPCSKQEWGIRALALQMYFAVGPNEPGMRLGEAAKDYARAFGVSEDLFTNLETAWLDKVSALPRSGAPDAQE